MKLFAIVFSLYFMAVCHFPFCEDGVRAHAAQDFQEITSSQESTTESCLTTKENCDCECDSCIYCTTPLYYYVTPDFLSGNYITQVSSYSDFDLPNYSDVPFPIWQPPQLV